jgi:hypothetical protein
LRVVAGRLSPATTPLNQGEATVRKPPRRSKALTAEAVKKLIDRLSPEEQERLYYLQLGDPNSYLLAAVGTLSADHEAMIGEAAVEAAAAAREERNRPCSPEKIRRNFAICVEHFREKDPLSYGQLALKYNLKRDTIRDICKGKEKWLHELAKLNGKRQGCGGN